MNRFDYLTIAVKLLTAKDQEILRECFEDVRDNFAQAPAHIAKQITNRIGELALTHENLAIRQSAYEALEAISAQWPSMIDGIILSGAARDVAKEEKDSPLHRTAALLLRTATRKPKRGKDRPFELLEARPAMTGKKTSMNTVPISATKEHGGLIQKAADLLLGRKASKQRARRKTPHNQLVLNLA